MVTGRDWVSQILPSASMTHSTSCGSPRCSWAATPNDASSRSCAPERTGLPPPSPFPEPPFPEPPRPRLDCRIFPVAVSTTKWSGVTAPETTVCPGPALASMTVSPRVPVTGFALNSTPAVAASTTCWTTTARATSLWRIPLAERYATARSVQSEAQQRRTAWSRRRPRGHRRRNPVARRRPRGRQPPPQAGPVPFPRAPVHASQSRAGQPHCRMDCLWPAPR